MRNDIGGQRGLVTAVGALVAAIAIQFVAMPVSTQRTDRPLGPYACKQAVHAGFFTGESLDQLAETQRLVFRHIRHLRLMPLYMSFYPINVTFYYILCFAQLR